jgi:hypothetical protein
MMISDLRGRRARLALYAGTSFALMTMSGTAFAADAAPVNKAPPPAAALPEWKPGLHYKFGEVDVTVSGTTTVGGSFRTVGRDPFGVSGLNTRYFGGIVSYNPTGGRNGDDSNLNWNKGDAVSSVVKTWLSVDANLNGFGAFVRAKAWYDYTLATHGVAWGNLPGGYLFGNPVNESGWNPNARALGVSLQEAYGYVKRDLGPATIDARVGNIVVPWGLPTLIPGGLVTTVNAVDNAALNRPGAQIEEIFRATPGAFARLSFLDNKATLDAFFLFKGPRNVAPPCGSFFSLQDWVASGCNAVLLSPVSDPQALATGGFVYRLPTPATHNANFGVGGSYVIDPIATKVGLHYAYGNSTSPVPSAMKSLRTPVAGPTGQPFIAGNPGGLNTAYFTEYPGGVNSFAMNFTTQIKATTLYGEYVYKANAPIALNSSDLLNAFSTNGQPSLVRWEYVTLPLGTLFSGYDRHQVGNLVLGARQVVPGILGATRLTLGAEFGMKNVYDLPNKMYRRYGRYDGFGVGQVNGVCATNSIAGQCSNDGYVSQNAWGYRLTASMLFDNVLIPKLSITPTIGLSHDVKGWAYDQTMYQGRVTLNTRLRVEYDKQYFVEIAYNPQLHQSFYDNGQDRQVLTLAGGFKF